MSLSSGASVAQAAKSARFGCCVALLFACAGPVANAAGLFDFVIDAAKGKVSAEKAPPYEFAVPAAQQSGKFVEVIRGANFRSIKKIGIVNFTVEFALYKSASASGGGYRDPTSGVRSTSSQSIEMQISAPDVPALQALTDRLYKQV